MSVESIAVDRIAHNVEEFLSNGNRELALRYAMAAVEPLLQSPSDELRFELRNKVFRKFKGVSYQPSDFESVDYNGFELSKRLPLLRGPRPPSDALANGEYFCVMGAAQTFGRLVKLPWPTLLSNAIGMPVVNLSRGGIGPEFFFHKNLLPLAQGARFVIVQVMSGRSVGCSDYPGGRKTQIGSDKVNRWFVLEKLWREDPGKALEYVRRWNTTYFEMYKKLRSLIARPTMLLWLSSRAPWDWEPESLLQELDWGNFPQLVGSELYKQVAGLFPKRLKFVTGVTTERPLNRITGEPCPYFGTGSADKTLHTEFGYYPSSESHAQLARKLEPWAKRVCDITPAPRSGRARDERLIVIHIGLRKCGSASIQTFFQQNERALQELSIDYPKLGRQGTGHHKLAQEIRGRHKFQEPRSVLSQCTAYWQSSAHRAMILSSEIFEEADSHQALAMRASFLATGGNQQFRIYLVIRDLVNLIPSSYAQKIKHGVHSFDFDTFFLEWMKERRIRYFETAERWAEAFGWENLCVRILNPAHLFNRELIDDFLAVCGITEETRKLNLNKTGIQNASPGWKVLEAIRALSNGSHGLPEGHPLARIAIRIGQEGGGTIGRRVGQAAMRVGESWGWNRDRGRYLTRDQAQRCYEEYCVSVHRLNEKLVGRLPEPADLVTSGFTAREFRPDVSHIEPKQLKAFYDDVWKAVRRQRAMKTATDAGLIDLIAAQ